MESSASAEDNVYTQGALAPLFARTALPIILVMVVNGAHALIDAYFLGTYVSAQALTAVTLMFPLFILLVAMSILVSNGFSSLYARLLGAGNNNQARQMFSEAIGLALFASLAIVILFALGGKTAIDALANGDIALATGGYIYLSILVFTAPLMFLLSLFNDGLRCEGRVQLMSAISLTSTLLNIGLNYVLIALMGWGIAGAAIGTVIAQLLALLAILYLRTGSLLLFNSIFRTRQHWVEMIALGAPSSLGYVGLSISTTTTVIALQVWSAHNYETMAGAFGIFNRLMTFMFLPLLGMSMAFQAITGNNFGARLWGRSNASILWALGLTFAYCLAAQLLFYIFRYQIGTIFVSDHAMITELARLMPIATLGLFLFGPLMIITTYFQTIGDAPRATILGLSRTYFFSIPLIILLPFWIGEPGIWWAGAVTEILVLILTIAVLWQRQTVTGKAWGLFEGHIDSHIN